MDDADKRLIIEIKNVRPVELADFTGSLMALADQYRRFAERSGHTEPGIEDTRLYIHQIRPGSIVAELVPMVDQLPMFVGAAASVIEFAKDLKTIYDFFLAGVGGDPGRPRQEYQNCAKILNPIARDQGSQVNFSIGQANEQHFHFHFSSTESAAIQHRIENHVAVMKAPITGLQSMQTFYWFQARGDVKAKTGDQGVIEAIDGRPRKVIFSTEEAKQQMLEGAIFQQVYIVDVEVATINGRPAVYKILQVHDVFPKDD